MPIPDFDDFFAALWGYKPFAWQKELASRLAADNTPKQIIAPTAAGKTAVIDAWVWALAKTLAAGKRRVPLRLFFVVDRRLVVDSAYERTKIIADKLQEEPKLADVAQVLQEQAQVDDADTDAPPLDAVLMRGGIPWERTDWCRSPVQPMAACATVDQVGSRLLFRGYGVGRRQRPVQAGLIGCDSLIVLDEAHLSGAFSRTLSDMMLFAKGEDDSGLRPLQWLEMTATPSGVSGEESDDQVLTCSEKDGDDKLNIRLSNGKRVEIVAKGEATAKKMAKEALNALSDLAEECKAPVVAVVVNTVALARAVYEEWKKDDTIDAILLTGRNRPRQRDSIIEQYKTRLLSDNRNRQASGKPLLIAATQCIEAGADFDFDFIISEGAPLDMLRQRFGRVDRLGRMDGDALRGKVIGRKKLEFYGDATTATCDWLLQNKSKDREKGKSRVIDFASIAISKKLADINAETRDKMTPPADAPPFLSPPLVRELERTTNGDATLIPLLLHGRKDNAEVFLLWRGDLPDFEDKENETEICRRLRWLPPQSDEMLSLPLWAAQAWLNGKTVTNLPDTESSVAETLRDGTNKPRRAVLCRRKDGELHAELLKSNANIRPGDVLVLRADADAGGCDEFGWNPDGSEKVADIAHHPRNPDSDKNVADAARRPRKLVMRLHPELHPQAAARWLDEAEHKGDKEGDEWLKKQAREIAAEINVEFPDAADVIHRYDEDDVTRGVCFIAAQQHTGQRHTWQATGLEEHCQNVALRTRRYAEKSGLNDKLADLLEEAARWHDVGKAESRFQVMLGKEPDRPPLARSGTRQAGLSRWKLAGLEWGERHEFWSVALAKDALADMSADDLSIVLWLIGTHHGQARLLPLPPKDPPTSGPDPIKLKIHGVTAVAPDPNVMLGLDFGWLGIWRTNRRRYGAWGLAYLESLLRMADMRTAKEETE